MQSPQSGPPSAVRGVWQRKWEQDPIGDVDSADTTTLVLWTQAPQSGIYVDLRLPRDAPGRSLQAAQAAGYSPRPEALDGKGLTALNNNMDEATVATFATQKSFAGILHFSNGDTTDSGDALKKDKELARLAAAAPSTPSSIPLCTCFWRRDLDYQPPSGGLDIGVCTSGPANADDGSIDLRETGDDGSYAELWHRLSGSNEGPVLALELVSENDRPRAGYWVRTGMHFAYAVGRPSTAECIQQLGYHPRSSDIASCTGKSLLKALHSLVDSGDVKSQLQLLGSYVSACGILESATPDASQQQQQQLCWNIQQSTDPGLVGCRLIDTTIESGVSCSVGTLIDSDGTIKTCSSSRISVGDTVLQSLAGKNGIVRRWRVMEASGPCHLF